MFKKKLTIELLKNHLDYLENEKLIIKKHYEAKKQLNEEDEAFYHFQMYQNFKSIKETKKEICNLGGYRKNDEDEI